MAFFLRSGKCMSAGRQVITLGFRQPPMRIFRVNGKDTRGGRVNEMVIDFDDPGSIITEFLAKVPGPEMAVGDRNALFRTVLGRLPHSAGTMAPGAHSRGTPIPSLAPPGCG